MKLIRKAWLTEHLKKRLSERTDLAEQTIRDLLDEHRYALLRWDSQRQRRYCLIYDVAAERLFVVVQELHSWAVVTILPIEFWQRRSFRWLVTEDKLEEAVLAAVHGQSMNPLINPEAVRFIPRAKRDDVAATPSAGDERPVATRSTSTREPSKGQLRLLRRELGDEASIERALAPHSTDIRVPMSSRAAPLEGGTRTIFIFDVAVATPTGFHGNNFYYVSPKTGLPQYVRVAQIPDQFEFWARLHELLGQRNIDPARVNRVYAGVAGHYHPLDVGQRFDEVFGTSLAEVRVLSSVSAPMRLADLGRFVAAVPVTGAPRPVLPAGSRFVLAVQYETANGYVRTHESQPFMLDEDVQRPDRLPSVPAFLAALSQVANVTQVPVEAIKAMYARIDGLYFPLDFAPVLDELLETSMTSFVERPASLEPLTRLPRTGVPAGLEDLLR
jgi:hypothetical protein